MEELNSRIAAANARARKLNDERQVNIGKREMLQARLNSLLEGYNAAHGTAVTLETLDAEVERVVREKTEEVEKMESVLGMVAAGDYAGAEALLGVAHGVDGDGSVAAQDAQISVSGAGVVSPAMGGLGGVASGVSVSGVPEGVAAPPPMPVAGGDFTVPPVSAPPIFRQIEEQSGRVKTSGGSKSITSFGDILGGTQFAGEGNA